METEIRRTRVRSGTLQSLNEQSLRNAFKLSDVDWQLQVDPKVNWMPESLVNVRFLPSYDRLSAEHRLRYNQLYALAICEQFIWFEQGIVIPIMQHILSGPKLNSELRECLKHFIADELKHSEMFRMLLEKADPTFVGAQGFRFYNLSGIQLWFYQTIVKNPDLFIAWIWMTIYFEERTMHISRLYRSEKTEALFARCHLLHMVDEARHLQVDQYLLGHLYDSQPAWKRSLAAWMYKRVVSAYAAPGRISGRVLELLGEEFPQDQEIFKALKSEFPLLPKNREFIEKMFGDEAIGRTRELLSRYPEMHKSLAAIS